MFEIGAEGVAKFGEAGLHRVALERSSVAVTGQPEIERIEAIDAVGQGGERGVFGHHFGRHQRAEPAWRPKRLRNSGDTREERHDCEIGPDREFERSHVQVLQILKCFRLIEVFVELLEVET